MKMTRTDILNQNNIVGHIVLMSATEILEKMLVELDKGEDKEIEIKLTYKGMELDLEGFIEHWQSQIDAMILEKAEELIDKRLSTNIEELANICRNATNAIKEKVGIKVDDWY